MGSVGNFLLGGSKDKQKSNQSNQAQSTSTNQSTSNQGSANISQQESAAGNESSNRAYDPLSAALTSTLGYTSTAGNMMGALLGLPPSTFNYATPPVPTSAPMPAHSDVDINHLVAQNQALQPTPVTPAPATPPPSPAPSPAPAPAPSGGSLIESLFGGGTSLHPSTLGDRTYIQKRENGGPVQAGQPYVVGEKQPEVFVPHTSGTIVPSVPQGMATALPSTQPSAYSGSNPYNPSPGNPSDALNTFSNSAGMNFILDQGQKAISGASAGNGTFNSGATGKALETYGQNIGKSYLGDYMNQLLNYGKLGLGSASALTGAGGTSIGQSTQSGGSVGTSFGNSQSTGSSQSTASGSGTSSGNASSKKGLIPDILG